MGAPLGPVTKSSKDHLTSEVYITEEAGFLAKHETGGVERPDAGRRYLYMRKQGRATRRNAPDAQVSKPSVLQTERGAFRRMRSGLRMLFEYVAHRKYKRNAFFYDTVERTGRATLNKRWKGNLAWALSGKR